MCATTSSRPRIFADLDDLNVFCLMLLLDLTIVGGKLVC
jgi:hypothetical protein